MDKKLVVNFDITDGPNKDQIFDAFKYARGGKIDLWFKLSEASKQPSGRHSSVVEKLGTPNAIANEYFWIKSIEYADCDGNWDKAYKIILVKGSCDLFYLDPHGHTGFKSYTAKGAYHVDFTMAYDVETHKGVMVCSDFRDCYYDPW